MSRPLVITFSGMGAQWPQMGTDLLNIPIFRETVERCHEVLKSKNVDLIHIITTKNLEVVDNILNAMVGSAVVQIGMANILKELKFEPDFLFGPSFGEIGCGYYDGCLTEEQAILAAYYRGLVCLKGVSIKGAMVFIHAGLKDIKPLVPKGIEAPCSYNSSACLVGGPEDLLKEFIRTLGKINISAMLVNSCGMPFHTSYLSDLRPILISHLEKVIPDPKKRSEKWKSTSVPIEKWGVEGEYCSAEYYTNNFCGDVYYEETCCTLPKNCITLEIGPTGQLFKLIEGNLPKGTHLALGQKGNLEAVKVFLDGLKEARSHGVQFDFERLATIMDY
ncbi:hypothetical protein ACFFRR_006214 [Megaselia abdita]